MTSPVHYHYDRFPPPDLDWQRLIPLIGPATAALARYDGLLAAIPNAQVLISPLTTQEAVLSSKIEGTQATMGEVLGYEAGQEADEDPRKREDIEEVLNYRRAMRQAVQLLKELPVCQRLIKACHETLLSGVRGEDKGRGRYRQVANWIGPPGCPVERARFVPIGPEHLQEGMDRWEKYLHGPAADRLVQLAIVHAEFESLHPFLDGNGRLGRMLIPLFLVEHKLLHAPTFYLSGYFEARRDQYYDRLLGVSRDDDWSGWCEFFLNALTRQAVENESKVRRILGLYEAKKAWVVEATHSQHAIRALDFIFCQPVFNSSDLIEDSKIPEATARRILKVIADHGLLKVIREASGRRPAIFAFSELLNIAEGRDVF